MSHGMVETPHGADFSFLFCSLLPLLRCKPSAVLQDAFPPSFVRDNKFQRQATLLLYLNDVEEGGCTHFDQLDLSIQPQCGKALLFFPAFADGTPDPR